MKKQHIGGLFIAVLLAATSLLTPSTVLAQDKGKEKPAARSEARTHRPYPFHGKLGAIDKEKKTLTIMGKDKSRTFYLDSKTKIVKDGKPATLEDAKVGEVIAGRVIKTNDGKEMLVSLRIGPKPPTTAKSKKKKSTADK